MVDFRKHLPEAQKTTREFGELQAAEERRLRRQYYPDRRPSLTEQRDLEEHAWDILFGESAAETMTDEWICLFYREGVAPQSTNLNVGPAASQIFSAAVMREQVDPS